MSAMTPKHPPPSPAGQVPPPQPASSFCCCGRRSVKVKPVNGSYPGYDIFEIRPGRHLRVMHLNPRKRDDRFQAEMEKYMAAQVKSGKYGTKGKTWDLPQPGRMDKTVSFQQYKQSNSNDQQGGIFSHSSSYQSYHGDVALSPAYKGEDNLSFRAESPEVERRPGPGQNGTIPREKKKLTASLSDKGPQGDGSQLTIKSRGTLSLTRASTATSVQLQMVEKLEREPQLESSAPTQNGQAAGANGQAAGANGQAAGANGQAAGANGHAAGANRHAAGAMPDLLPTIDPAKEQTVIFFIHGVGGSAAVWQAQADYFLREGYEVVMPELIGHGFSSAPQTPESYNFNEIACDLLVIFDLYCKRKNMVVGHSYGSSFATVLARQRARLVTQLVMVSGGSPTPLAPQPGTFSAPTWLLACCKPVLNRGFRRSAFHNKKLHTMMGRAFDVPTYVLKYTMNGQLWLEGGDDYHRWLTPPTLLVYGRQDKLVTLEEEQEMERIIIGSMLEIIEGASHMVMMEQPDMVNNLLHRFLLGKLKAETSPAASEVDFKSINNSRASLRSNKSVPSGLVAGNLK